MTETREAPMAYLMLTPRARVSAGTTTTPPPRPVSAPRKPARNERIQTAPVKSNAVIGSPFAEWCGRRLLERWAGLEPFCDALGLSEEVKVIGTAGLGVGAAHIEAAEGMRANHGTGAFAIEVEIAYVEGTACSSLLRRIAGVKRAGEAV